MLEIAITKAMSRLCMLLEIASTTRLCMLLEVTSATRLVAIAGSSYQTFGSCWKMLDDQTLAVAGSLLRQPDFLGCCWLLLQCMVFYVYCLIVECCWKMLGDQTLAVAGRHLATRLLAVAGSLLRLPDCLLLLEATWRPDFGYCWKLLGDQTFAVGGSLLDEQTCCCYWKPAWRPDFLLLLEVAAMKLRPDFCISLLSLSN